MKYQISMSLTAALLLAVGVAHAQEPIYKCGPNEYTNSVPPALRGKCKLLRGGNVTVVQRPRATPAMRVASVKESAERVPDAAQRSRDLEARQILESELQRAEGLRADLLKEYNNGEPDKLGPETRNYQKYLDRVAQLKASIDRNESDIAGLRRELDRHSEANSESK